MQLTLTRIGTCCVGLTMMALFGAAAMAADSWLPVDPEAPLSPQAPTVTVGRADDAGFEATIGLAGIALESRTTKGGHFVEVIWPDAAIAGGIGLPAVPVVRRLFIAPPGATVSATAELGRAVVVRLAEAGYAVPVMPLQAPVPKLPGALERAPFDYDAAAYGLDVELPGERVLLEELGHVRGQRLFLLEVYPNQ